MHGQFGTITTARWARARTFEQIVSSRSYASEIATTAIGGLGLHRPTAVATVDAKINANRTAALLLEAHERATQRGEATLISQLSVPFVGFEGNAATEVKPDFAVVAPTDQGSNQSWLIVGDVKDYERVRSRIGDDRLLKGFLQVALGAESLAAWSQLPAGMHVHPHGALAVPRNSFLQPEVRLELLEDHRSEVRMRVAERTDDASIVTYDANESIDDFVRHLRSSFDPSACVSCTLFGFCRSELRQSDNPTDLLIEIGVPEADRPSVVGLVDGSGEIGSPGASLLARVRATVDGFAQLTGQLRTDAAGAPGTVNVVLAKSDSTTLGIYGIAVQRIDRDGAGEWHTTVFDAPQSEATRRGVARVVGTEIVAAIKDRRLANGQAASDPDPVHLVVPDATTADVLTAIADHLAGAELSRLRWANDKAMGRPALTFNGEPAQVPHALNEVERTGVSFLLEEDRARAFTLRTPVLNLTNILGQQFIAGGPAASSMRLDYLVGWARPTSSGRDRHRQLSDAIERLPHTPGALLATHTSNEIHAAFVGIKPGDQRPADPATYEHLIRDELAYKAAIVDAALAALSQFQMSRLASAHRAIESDAQAVWRRRMSLHASDLVRFGRVPRWWRNSLVATVEADDLCRTQMATLSNPQYAHDAATDAGMRPVAQARVVSTSPLTLEIDSRQIETGSRLVLMHTNESACVEEPGITVKTQKTSIKIDGLSIGPLQATKSPRQWHWLPEVVPNLAVGDTLIVADFAWFSSNAGNRALNVKRPVPDVTASPGQNCSHDSFESDPVTHKYCCRPHEDIEAEWSNKLAEQRSRGELNPQVWPPVVDTDGFQVIGAGAALADPHDGPVAEVPASLTLDDVE